MLCVLVVDLSYEFWSLALVHLNYYILVTAERFCLQLQKIVLSADTLRFADLILDRKTN